MASAIERAQGIVSTTIGDLAAIAQAFSLEPIAASRRDEVEPLRLPAPHRAKPEKRATSPADGLSVGAEDFLRTAIGLSPVLMT